MKLKEVVPMVDPKELVVGGWDINSVNLCEAMKRAQVF
jgi:myo-inositol-1-phosphate synthase